MIRLLDLPDEKPMSLPDAAAVIGRMTGKTPALTTIWRWCLKGTKGVKLQSFCVGRQRFVTVAALERFIEQCSVCHEPEAPIAVDITPASSPQVRRLTEQRVRQIEAARRRLDEVTNRCKPSRVGDLPGGANRSA